MKGQMSKKAEYGHAWAIADGSTGEGRRKKHLEREVMREGDLSMAVGEGTTAAICGDTAGLVCVSAP